MDSSSRRAFSLDSRTVWVEQQLINGIIVPRDNLPLGPGEYKAQIPERHIGSPILGKYRGPADHFTSFNSGIRTKTPLNNSQLDRQSPDNISSPPKKTDFMTIFHDHDERQPLDPNKRFCETPGSYLGQDPLLRSVNHDGVKTATNVHFGPNNLPFGDRMMYKVALPEYEVKYDSPVLKPATKLGSFDRTKREIQLGQKSYYDEGPRESPSPSKHLQQQHSPKKFPSNRASDSSNINVNNSSSEQPKSVYEIRCSLVPLPKLKTRRPEQLVFKDISYGAKSKVPLDLTPSKINRVASVHMFDGLIAIPRKHKSAEYNKSIVAIPLNDH